MEKTSNKNTKRNNTKRNNTKRNNTRKNNTLTCFFDTPAKYATCIHKHPSGNGVTLDMGSIVVRNDHDGAKTPSTEVPAFFGDQASTQIYGRNRKNTTTRYKVVKQPLLFVLDAMPLIALAQGAFGPITKEEEETVVIYLSPPINEETSFHPEFNEEDDAVIQPTGFAIGADLENYKKKGYGLYINRRIANIVCRLGFDGWVAMPGALYQWVPSRNAVIPYAPEIMLCKWDSFMEQLA